MKFYDTVMNQDVVEHKVAKKPSQILDQGPGSPLLKKKGKKGFEMTSRLTKRAVG